MRILSISGGGFQALYSARLLAMAEERFGPLSESFDLFAGTSAGAMIAAAAASGVEMGTVRDVMISEGPAMFSPRPSPAGAAAMARDVARYVRGSKYDGRRLSAVVRAFSGTAALSSVATPLLVTSVRLKDAEPVAFTDATHPEVQIFDAVMASAAAPMILPAHEIGEDLYADGALFANTPDMVAIGHAISVMEADPGKIRMVSVGAMNLSPPLVEPDDPGMGIMGWVRDNRIFRTTIGAQARHAEQMSRALLGNRYVRIDASREFPGRNAVGLDVASREAIAASGAAAELSRAGILEAVARICHPDDVGRLKQPPDEVDRPFGGLPFDASEREDNRGQDGP